MADELIRDDDDITEEVDTDAWRAARIRNRRTTEQLREAARARRAENRADFDAEHSRTDDGWACRLNPCPWHEEKP